MKYTFLILFVSLFLVGCFGKDVVKESCCEIERGCASGPVVTAEYCEELNGEFFENMTCNTDDGSCE